MTTCEQAMEALTARLMGEPEDGGTDEQLDRHLETCPRCRREADEIRALWQGLGELEEPPDGVPSTRLRARFYAMLAAAEPAPEVAQSEATDRSSSSGASREAGRVLRWRRRVLGSESSGLSTVTRLAAAASVLVALLGGALAAGWWLGGGGRSGDDLDSLRAEVRSLHEMVALSLLEQPKATDRLRGVDFGARLDRPDRPVVTALVDTVARDPNVNVRLAAIDALAPVASEPSVRDALIRALPQQDAPMVQIALADLLLDNDSDDQGAAARAAVRALLDQPTLRPEVRSHLVQRLGTSI